jgi:predicted DNA-binding ribbon-helix-helix protein
VRKRSLTIAGHRTSLALEQPFWDGLDAMARVRGVSVPALIAEIDDGRGAESLSSAVRLAVLAWYRERAGRS